MLDFYLTATGDDGKQETIRLQAVSARKAVEQAEIQGYRDITLHTDDASAAAVQFMDNVGGFVLSPADIIELRSLSNTGYFFFLAKNFYGKTLVLPIVTIAVIAYNCIQSGSPGITGGIAAVFLVAPALIAAWMAFFSPTRKYDALVEASCWGRWEEVMTHVPALRGTVPEFELDVRLACALAATGRFDEGLALYEKYLDDPEVPRWMYLGRLSELYERVHRHEDAINCHRQAYEEAPENPTVVLDLAMSLLSNDVELPFALELIAWAESQPMSDILQLFLPYVKGLAALNSQQNEEALALFLDTEEKLQPLTAAHAPIRLVVDIVIACQAIALAASGKGDEAEKRFTKARPRLEALDSRRLMDRYKKVTTR